VSQFAWNYQSLQLPTYQLPAIIKVTFSGAPAPAASDVSLKPVNESPIECKWAAASTSISGYQPTKSGDYVHAVANTDGVICVRDANGNLQVLQLKNAQSQTVRGRPPFETFSHNLSHFKIYYQGNLLKLPSNDIKNITLKEQKYE
jgi:hypothetical protein